VHNETTAPAVLLRDVSKRFGDGPLVLERIDLSLARGDFVSVIGPSGCGKSTLLRLVAGLSPVSSGSLTVEGVAPERMRDSMAYIFQEATLLPWLNVQRNVEVPMRIRRLPRAHTREVAERMLRLVGLEHAGRQYPLQLSGGMKMRVSIARALALSPRVLLLDEPFGALDEMTRDHLNEELLELRAREEWTALFVTHSVAEAVFLSNRILVLSANPGRVHREVAVPFPYPRTEETRQSPEFHALVAEVSRLLRSVERSAPGRAVA
jgi:NitT/TauT family transport system ATP-binding protein